MNRRIILIALAIAALAAGAFAALSPEKADWAKGPVQYLMTPEELTQWNALQTDQEADAFIALFWARRDPTPGTPRNEFREAFDARVKAADENFSSRSKKGSMTDPGRILIVFGGPKTMVHTGGTSQAGFSNATRDTEASPGMVWTYEGEAAKQLFGAPRVQLQFIDRYNNGDMRLIPASVDVTGAEKRIVAAMITQPNLKLQQAQPAPAAAAAPPAAPPATLKTASLETAIADAKANKIDSKGATVTYTQLLSPAGDSYVPVGLFVPASANVAADAADTFFGVIEDATGKRVAVFEEPAKGFVSKNNTLYDYTANLPAGTYTATFGLAKAGVPVLVATGPLEASALAKDAVGTSNLVLADIVEMMEASPVKAPFAFGKLKIVPRASFSNKDELGYFIELHNPGIDASDNLPKLQAKLELVQPSGPPIVAPLSDAQALPLSGAIGAGEYAIISGIPLSQLKTPLKPGDYTLKVKVVDTVSKKSYNLEQKFKIAG